MGRRLPDAITRNAGESDVDFSDREAVSKRRLQIFKRIYQNYYLWESLREAGHVSDIIQVEGTDYYLGDLLVGFHTLPPQQQKAFDLICLQGYTESAATLEILPKSKWSTPVQQYSDDGLRKMVAAYDAKQVGAWDPKAAMKKKRRIRKRETPVTPTPIPEVPDDVKDETAPKFRRIDHLDWSVCSADNQRLADFINATTHLGITGQQVKAVAFLRKPWYRSTAEQTHRSAEAYRKEQEKAKYAYETDEQRAARFEAARRLKSAEAAKRRAEKLDSEVRTLREKAGLDPKTGEPVA